ncbi:hypothetical protein AVEN_254032-1 [Araneus ventricosus]|uniref:Uncharacterized protein n=1 Tax=Araneus ventricosus TaxID=182803 RepID=A0A4Y2E6I8_ARAVE|nr:hypothetical protein AVEN_254032-1 [Araneus ventricosus]
MRVILACLVASLCVMAASAALTCFGDEEKCAEDECCIQLGNTFAGICKKHHEVVISFKSAKLGYHYIAVHTQISARAVPKEVHTVISDECYNQETPPLLYPLWKQEPAHLVGLLLIAEVEVHPPGNK